MYRIVVANNFYNLVNILNKIIEKHEIIRMEEIHSVEGKFMEWRALIKVDVKT